MTRRHWILALCVLSCGTKSGSDPVDGSVMADGPGGSSGSGGSAGSGGVGGSGGGSGSGGIGGSGGMSGSGGIGGSGGMSGRPVGDPCTSGSDCADGTCLSLPGGYCSRTGCDSAGCPSGSQCNYLADTSTYACLKSCTAASDCRNADGYTCDSTNTCWVGGGGGGGSGGTGGTTGGCSDPWGRDCPVGQACNLDTHECVTSCSQDRPCNGGCCSSGQCVAGTALNACGESGWHCYDCANGCTQGAGCSAGVCQCTSGCIPSGSACTVGVNGCCSGFCAGLNGNTRCQ